MSHPLLRRTITTLTALADRHEDGDRVDAIVSATLATLIYAVEEGRTDSLWAKVSPIWTQWGVEASERARASLDSQQEPKRASLKKGKRVKFTFEGEPPVTAEEIEAWRREDPELAALIDRLRAAQPPLSALSNDADAAKAASPRGATE